ncbi:MAG: methyl-accepting chemotaxis protein [Pseudomonadota bacterium]
MKISHRLAILTATATAAMIAVGGLGLYQLKSIQSELNVMTGEALPVKDGLLRLSQLDDALITSLLNLAQSATDSEYKERSALATSALDIAATHDEAFSEKHSREAHDFGESVQAKAEIDSRVQARLDNRASYLAEKRNATINIATVEAAVNKVIQGIDGLNRSANIEANKNRRIAAEASRLQREARRLIGLLTEVRVLLYTTDATTSKFKIAPINEKLAATFDSVDSVLNAPGSALRGQEQLGQPAALRERFLAPDTGLLAIRTQMLGDESGAKSAYRKARRALGKDLTAELNSLTEIVDSTELEILVANSWVEKSLELISDPDGIGQIGKALISGVKDMRFQIDRLADAADVGELNSQRQLIERQLKELSKNADDMQAQLTSFDSEEISEGSAEVKSGLALLSGSLTKVSEAKTDIFTSDLAIQAVIRHIQSISAERETSARQEIASIDGYLANIISRIETRGNRSVALIVLISLFGIAVSALVSVYIVRSIIKRVRSAVELAEAVAAGELKPVESAEDTKSNDEIAEIEAAMSNMIQTLVESVKKIRVAAASVGSEVAGISEGNVELNRRTDTQSQELQTATSSSSKISELLHVGAQSLQEASEKSKNANTSAVEGQQLMRDAMATMKNIEQKANDINQITEIINSIAFQTNLLAINAAVEASRAGAAGKGFAVVATEVRQLAQKSKDSAHDIRHIIDSTVTEVASGSDQVNQAAGHMQSTSTLISDVASRIEGLVKTADIQVQAIADIDSTVTNLSAMNADNVQLTEKTTAATEDLHEQSRHLEEAVQVFRLPQEGQRDG